MADAVLDASALLAVLLEEPGAGDVARVLPRALVSTVNYAEVISKLIDLGFAPEIAVDQVSLPSMRVVALDEATAVVAARLRAQTCALGLSLGDRACLALAKSRGLPVITADRAWAAVDVGVEIVLIR